MNFGPHTIVVTEEERQMILMALAHLAVERPGWQMILTETASKMDAIQGQMTVKDVHLRALKGHNDDIKVENGKPIMFERFRIMHQTQTTCVIDYVKTIIKAAANLEPLIPRVRSSLDEERSAQSPGAPEG